MTTDKIRLAIGEHIWNFWLNQNNIDQIRRAEKLLRSEIESGLRRRPQDFAEHELLCKKLGVTVQLNLK